MGVLMKKVLNQNEKIVLLRTLRTSLRCLNSIRTSPEIKGTFGLNLYMKDSFVAFDTSKGGERNLSSLLVDITTVMVNVPLFICG